MLFPRLAGVIVENVMGKGFCWPLVCWPKGSPKIGARKDRFGLTASGTNVAELGPRLTDLTGGSGGCAVGAIGKAVLSM